MVGSECVFNTQVTLETQDRASSGHVEMIAVMGESEDPVRGHLAIQVIYRSIRGLALLFDRTRRAI